jgi:hypothetical protein
MLDRIVVALRHADRSVAVALALACVGIAGASALVPTSDSRTLPVERPLVAPLALNLEPAKAVDTIVNPSSLVLHTAPVELPPMLERFLVEQMLVEQRCLAEAMYYEARGEGEVGEKAIAEVVFHRMKTPGYPHSVCGVVYERAAPGHGCQFTFTCDGALEAPRRAGAWLHAKHLAARILSGFVRLENETEGAVSFHAANIEPGWGDGLVRTIQIGNHVFYRRAPRTSSS